MVRVQKLALFLPRDAMHWSGLCCWPVSVRLFATFAYCIQMAEDIIKHVFRRGSVIILVFDPKRRYPVTRGSRKLGRKIHGVGKLRFSTEIAVYLVNSTR